MLIGKIRNRFQFNDDFIVTNKIRPKIFVQKSAFISYLEFLFTYIRNVAQLEFKFQSLLINRLCKATTEHFMHFHRCSDNFIRLFLE